MTPPQNHASFRRCWGKGANFRFAAAASSVPEHSSTFVLAGIGMAALLIFRRFIAVGALPKGV
jgi:hypothetical protein